MWVRNCGRLHKVIACVCRDILRGSKCLDNRAGGIDDHGLEGDILCATIVVPRLGGHLQAGGRGAHLRLAQEKAG